MFGRKHIFKWPPFSKSRSESAMRYSELARPLSEAVSFSVVGQHSGFTGVLRLLFLGCPAAVALFVVAVARNPINRCFWEWLWSHVVKEVDKRIKPSLAYGNAFPAIKMIVWIVWTVAASLHFFPGCVLSRIAHSPSVRTMATTRLNRLPSEISTSHGRRISALTYTLPARIARLGVASKLDHCELAVLAANFVRAVFTASAGLNVSRPNGTAVKNLLDSAFTAKQPVRSVLATKFGTGVAYRDEIAEWLSSDVFDVGRQLDRIIRRHSSTPRKLDCDIEPERSTTTALARFILA